MWNVIRVKGKDTRTTSDLADSSGVSVGDFERVNAGSVDEL